MKYPVFAGQVTTAGLKHWNPLLSRILIVAGHFVHELPCRFLPPWFNLQKEWLSPLRPPIDTGALLIDAKLIEDFIFSRFSPG